VLVPIYAGRWLTGLAVDQLSHMSIADAIFALVATRSGPIVSIAPNGIKSMALEMNRNDAKKSFNDYILLLESDILQHYLHFRSWREGLLYLILA